MTFRRCVRERYVVIQGDTFKRLFKSLKCGGKKNRERQNKKHYSKANKLQASKKHSYRIAPQLTHLNEQLQR